MGGENHGSSKKRECDIGSSPRGRGKPQRWRGSPCGCRLIPAWAGKTHTRRWSAVEAAAHPRVGGENHFSRRPITLRRGSSPRGRGKPLEVQDAGGVPRLIPAWAGKTPRAGFRVSRRRAHPRVGGENLEYADDEVCDRGSSPRGRGKLSMQSSYTPHTRLIPAWAGKTSTPTSKPLARRAHPRVGGENRTRQGAYWLDEAHPRVGGENVLAAPMIVLTWGSSPRGRGKPSRCPSSQTPRRLIPAWAGKTVPPVTLPGYQGAHPRVGGENANRDNKYQLQKGSSPRGRGKLVPCAGIPGVAGLIPAWAGKTFGEATEMHASWAHPRVGGENETRHAYYESVTGSSPRGRGKL